MSLGEIFDHGPLLGTRYMVIRHHSICIRLWSSAILGPLRDRLAQKDQDGTIGLP